MKTLTSKSFAIVLFLAPVFAFAESGCATVKHLGNAADLSVQASGEALQAGGESVQGSVQVAAGAVAVPVWIVGSAAEGSAQLSGAVADGSGATGQALWDFATGDSSERPALDTNAGMPAPKATEPKKPAAEPSPAEAMKSTAR